MCKNSGLDRVSGVYEFVPADMDERDTSENLSD
jgi:hypothetical protein